MAGQNSPQVQAPAEKLRRLRALQEQARQIEAARLALVDVFGLLEYEPNCRRRYAVRTAVAAEVGAENPFDQLVTDAAAGLLPEPCGQCPQELFHAAPEFDVLYGGAAGGGKSRALTAEGIRACVRHAGIRVGAFRRTYPELEESMLAELAAMGYAQALGATWNAAAHDLRFPNGSLLMFRYAETLTDATRRQGGQYQLLLFDERTLTPPDVVAFLESRLRSGRADIPVLGIRSSSNPGGAGHGDVKKRYITATEYGRSVVTDERGRKVRFIPSRLDDNPHVNAEYAEDLKRLPEKLRAAFLDGNWDVFAGQMFTQLSQDRHVVPPVTLPGSWRRLNGIDWGFAKPWAVLWAAVDEDGRAWFYRELYAAGVLESDQAKRIVEAEADGEHVEVRYADDAMWATRGEAKPIATVYAENGCHLTPAGKGSRVTGWQRVGSYLAERAPCAHHRALGWPTCPGLHIFTTCPEFYRTLADLPHATRGDVEDAETTGEDHLPDAARYLLINLGGGPEFPILESPAPNPFDEVEKLQPMSIRFAVRPDDDAELFDEAPPEQGATQLAPWA
jgi:hypothetical protein